jgi:hypothetical protein
MVDFIKSLFVLLYGKEIITESELYYLLDNLDEKTKPEEFAKKVLQISGTRYKIQKEEEKVLVDNYI